jgi:assimilatory nitrate reductase catalytic subunit
VSWDEALSQVVSEIQRIQATYGDDAFAMLSGVSLTNEKSYLVGKFARLALHTANLDYNGRFCMVSAGVGNKKALGIDRAPNPWSDIPLADVVWVAGSNVAETFPITTSYIWRARDRGAKLIVQDPRVVPLARTADLFLPVRPGSDSALFGAVLHELIRNDWLDHDFIDAHTVDFDQAAAAAADMTPAWAAGSPGCPHRAHRGGGRAVGHRRHRDDAARPRHRAADQGRRQRARRHQPRSRHRQVRQARLRVSTITGQGNGQGGREHGHKCDQLPGNRDITNPEHRAAVAKVWGCRRVRDPRQGHPGPGDHRGHPRRHHQGPAVDLLQPARVGAGQQLHRRSARQARVLLRHRLLPLRVRPARRCRAARVAARGGRGHLTSGEGRIIKINAAVTPAGRGPPGLGDPARDRRTARQGRALPVPEHP